jgi:trehalose 6-phosphate phosphatase
MSARTALVRGNDLALFLDVDGTLLEIAATPDRVRVPASLRNTLQLAHRREQGAFALLSGRSLEELDELFGPHRFPASAKHGLELRLPSGEVVRAEADPAVLDPARRWLSSLPREHRGLLLEDKAVALAMHYRLAPRMEAEVDTIMSEIVQELGGAFVLRRGKCVIEIVPRGFDERSAIRLFMQQPEFAGRTPVFVGDAPSDEVGFQAVNEMGGHSIRVGNLEQTAARFRFSSVSTVAAWLRDRNLNR